MKSILIKDTTKEEREEIIQYSKRLMGELKVLLRELREDETELLREFLYEAIFVPDGVVPPPREIIEQPELAVYYENFGSGKADFCIVAEDDGRVVGAVWTRIMNDYGHIDDDTPSFAISLYKEYRGHGIGTQLMLRMLELLRTKGYRKASLAVQKANYAVRMYEKVGFITVDENSEEYIMVNTEMEGDHMAKTLVAYFSATGTTGIVATALAEAAEADIYEIAPEVPYTNDDLNWRDEQSRSSVEMNDPAGRPAIGGEKVSNMEQYDTIFLCFPIWWYVAPTIVNSFLESYNLHGKKIVLFATSGGSGFGKTLERLENSAPGAQITEGKILNGEWSKDILKSLAEKWM